MLSAGDSMKMTLPITRVQLITTILSFSACLATTLFAAQNAVSMAGRATVYAPNGMIATSHPLASSAGLKVLQNGGNAVDAAVTAAAVLSVTEPMMTGIGGDVFAIVWLADEKRLTGMNSSGRSGSLLTREVLIERGHESMPSTGPESVTVPGALSGWAELLSRHGTLSLGRALKPAIDIARGGFPVSPRIARFWKEREEDLKKDEVTRTTFLLKGDRAPGAGEWYVNLDYAKTLEIIAAKGPAVFYEGELADRIVSRLEELGGFLTKEDLAVQSPLWVTPISVDYKGHRLYELPPNGQGIAALEMLKILESFDLKGMGHNSAEYLHHLIEAKKLAFADLEQFVGDPEHMTIDADDLLTDKFIESRRSLITSRAIPRPEPGSPLTESETTYLTASDKHGNMVSFINSVSATFGSRVVVPGTGFVLQNRGAGFTLKEGVANTVGPRKRPFHTIIPAFVTQVGADGSEEPWLSYGVMGGSMQPQGHVQVLLNLIEFEMDLQEAVDAARFRHLKNREVALEPVFSEAIRADLASRGHELVSSEGVFFGGGQVVERLKKGWAGASDPRMDGHAAGH
jgi:gamma-glutamyltranspeptidase/glutathione hydrolase